MGGKKVTKAIIICKSAIGSNHTQLWEPSLIYIYASFAQDRLMRYKDFSVFFT